MSVKTKGFKNIRLSPETHTRLAEMTNKTQIFNDVIAELLNMKMNAMVQTNPQVSRPERFAPPSTKKEILPNG